VIEYPFDTTSRLHVDVGVKASFQELLEDICSYHSRREIVLALYPLLMKSQSAGPESARTIRQITMVDVASLLFSSYIGSIYFLKQDY